MDRLNLDIDGSDTNVAPDVLILPSRLKQFAKVRKLSVIVVGKLKVWSGGRLHDSNQPLIPHERAVCLPPVCEFRLFCRRAHQGGDCATRRIVDFVISMLQ